LDPLYTPGTPVEIAIFRFDNTYMYAVAAKTVKYLSGKTIIAMHKRTMDGQAVFKALTKEATGHTVRQINETKLKDALKLMDANGANLLNLSSMLGSQRQANLMMCA
jgi:hypothetical protein